MKILKAIKNERHRFQAENGYEPTRIALTKEDYSELVREIHENARYYGSYEPEALLGGIQMVEGMLPEIGWRLRALP